MQVLSLASWSFQGHYINKRAQPPVISVCDRAIEETSESE